MFYQLLATQNTEILLFIIHYELVVDSKVRRGNTLTHFCLWYHVQKLHEIMITNLQGAHERSLFKILRDNGASTQNVLSIFNQVTTYKKKYFP